MRCVLFALDIIPMEKCCWVGAVPSLRAFEREVRDRMYKRCYKDHDGKMEAQKGHEMDTGMVRNPKPDTLT